MNEALNNLLRSLLENEILMDIISWAFGIGCLIFLIMGILSVIGIAIDYTKK